MFAVKAGQRFSLLLLVEGEQFVRDWVASCDWPEGVGGAAVSGRRCLTGQLRLATKSLFFEPDDVRVPIVRLPFSNVQGMEGHGARSFELGATRWVKMKANAADVPFTFEKVEQPTCWSFSLLHSSLTDFMPLAQQMLLASRLSDAEQEELLQVTCAQQEAGVRFDVGHLRSPGDELVVCELPAQLVTPLVQEPGRLALSNSRLYFQPLHNWSGDAAVFSHPLAAIAAVARRHSSALRDVGLEIFFAQPRAAQGEEAGCVDVAGPSWGAASAFFAFSSPAERESFLQQLAGQSELGQALAGGRGLAAACSSVLEAESGWLDRVTAAWQHGQLSNFQYLLFLNAASGRTFNDLSQYPVFPWVLADYTSASLDLSDPASFRDLSKPVGALNPKRLAALKERYYDMPHDDPQHPPFLYATHYSTPGYVMFYTLRAAPAHMLRLQSGRFDAPDRLFCSICETWAGVVSTNPTDVKELIPEFYMPDPGFLVNAKGLALGVRQNGRPVGDVELPPWADGSPQRFLALHRAALESPYVSANLHHWIDLVFGVASRGAAAEKADNVFRHLTYPGAVDIDSLADPVERKALTTAIQEFGQAPRAIFTRPHARRLVCPPPPPPEQAFGAGEAGSGQAVSLALVKAVIAAASEVPSLPLEVPELLNQLDVLQGQPRTGEADEACTAADAGAAPSECEAASQADDASEDSSPASRQSSASRLRSFVGGMRQAVTSPADKAGERLRGLFARKASSSADAPAPSLHECESLESLPSASADAAGGLPQPSPPKSPAFGSGLKSSVAGAFSSRWQALTTSSRSAARNGSAANSELEGETSGSRALQQDGYASSADKQQQGSSAGTGPDAASAVTGPGAGAVVWKMASRRTAQQVPVEDEADSLSGSEADEVPPSASSTPPGSPQDAAHPQRQQCMRVLATGLRAGRGAAAGAADIEARSWGPGLRDKVKPGRVFALSGDAVNATAVAAVGGQQYAYAALASGSLRVLNLSTSEQLRAAPLGTQPLASLALLPLPASAAAGVAGSLASHPLVLVGSYDSHVSAYQVETGRCLGMWPAHSDTVSCLELVSAIQAQPMQLISASWDGTVAAWGLQEGRQPWSGRQDSSRLLADLGSGVWALAADSSGSLLLTGMEDGMLALLDLRTRSRAWEHPVSDDYIGSVRFLPPSSELAVVASGDGTVSVLDLRRPDSRLSYASCGSPLRCLATDGSLALCGSEEGKLHLWDVAQQLGRQTPRGRLSQPGPSGLYHPLECAPPSAINALAVQILGSELVVAAGHEGGILRMWTAAI